jgi:CBS domain-containing protein
MRCCDVIKEPLVACRPTDSVRACAELMKKNNVGFLPVIDAERKLIGVITDRDLALRIVAEGKPLSTEVREVMTLEVISVLATADFADAEKAMADSRKSRIPLVNEAGICTGVISLSDIAQSDSRWRAGKVFQEVTKRESSPAHTPWNVV